VITPPIWPILLSRLGSLYESPDLYTPAYDVAWEEQPILQMLARLEDQVWLMRAMELAARVAQSVNQREDLLEEAGPMAQAMYKEQVLASLKHLITQKIRGRDEVVTEISDTMFENNGHTPV
jgi:hypothetical protein